MEETANKFLTKYFPPSKAEKLRGDSLPFLNLNLKVFMKHGKDTRA